MNKLNNKTLCIWLVYICIARRYTVHTISSEYMILMGKHEGKRLFGRSKRRREDNSNGPKAVGWEGVDWIDLFSDRDKWRTVMNWVMNLQVSYITRRGTVDFPRRTLLYGVIWLPTNICMNMDRSGKALQCGLYLFWYSGSYTCYHNYVYVQCVCRREDMSISAKFVCVCWRCLCVAVCVCVGVGVGVGGWADRGHWNPCLFMMWYPLHFP